MSQERVGSAHSRSRTSNRAAEAAPRQKVAGPRATALSISDATIVNVWEHARATFGSQMKADHWMHRFNPLFEGRTPYEVLQVDAALVEAELVRIDHGVYV